MERPLYLSKIASSKRTIYICNRTRVYKTHPLHKDNNYKDIIRNYSRYLKLHISRREYKQGNSEIGYSVSLPTIV